MLATELIARLQHIVDKAGEGTNVKVMAGGDEEKNITDIFLWNARGLRWAEISVEAYQQAQAISERRMQRSMEIMEDIRQGCLVPCDRHREDPHWVQDHGTLCQCGRRSIAVPRG